MLETANPGVIWRKKLRSIFNNQVKSISPSEISIGNSLVLGFDMANEPKEAFVDVFVSGYTTPDPRGNAEMFIKLNVFCPC